MLAALPSAFVAPAPAASPATMEEAVALAHSAARRVSDPGAVLAGDGAPSDKLAAVDALLSRIPGEPLARQVADLDALAAAAVSAAQPPEVRAKALTFLGYAMNQVADDAARARGLQVLLGALRSPAYRLFALRGLGPACHGLPKSGEAAFQGGLLDLLDGPAAGEDRETALVALFSFVSTRDDLVKRAPILVAQLDARLLAPIEADPAGFTRDPRSTPGSREMTAATIWSSARHRQTLGDPKPAARVHAVLERLLQFETDPAVVGWLKTYRDAPAPRPGALTESTTRREPTGSVEP